MLFSKLSKTAKERAVRDFKESGYIDEIFMEDARFNYIDPLVSDLADYGINIETDARDRPLVRWDLSFSQGSGLCFTTDAFEPWKYIKKTGQSKRYAPLTSLFKSLEKKNERCEVIGNIYRSSHFYNHENTVSLNTEINLGSTPKAERASELAEDVLQEIFEFCQNKMKDTHRKMEEEYLDQMSEGNVISIIEDVGFEYDKNGKRLKEKR